MFSLEPKVTSPGHAYLRSVSAARPDVMSDDELMHQVQDGAGHAYAELVTRYQGRVRRLCWVLTRDQALARDLAQDAFLQLWNSRASYRANGKWHALLFATARNLALRAHRRRRFLQTFSFLLASPEEEVDMPEDLDRLESLANVREALLRLPERFRTPLVLRFVDELSYDDVAQVIGRTPSAARSRVHYGLKALALTVAEKGLS
jgi:RNA polymerase sigma-70 factor, ECF subfamily